MLGPDCVLVRRSTSGFRCLGAGEARAIQAAILGNGHDPEWLFEQCGRIAEALASGEIALAQINGLQIPIGELDDPALRRLGAIAELTDHYYFTNAPVSTALKK